jgi:16S rRNA (uracil1498-N3)-methyltransferase
VNVLLCDRHEVGGDGTVSLTDARAAHVRTVLRAVAGDAIRVGVVDGSRGRGEVLTIDESQVVLRLDLDAEAPPLPSVDLLLAVPRPKVLRRLWAQLAALGVGRIILTNAAKVERNYFDTHVLDEAVYRPLLIEGLQQAGDTRLPRVSIHRRFRPLVEDDLAPARDGERRLVAHPRGERSLFTVVGAAPARRVLLAIGPEGGWTAFELDLLSRAGFEAISLGDRTLRTDTACVAVLALVHEALRTCRTQAIE